jgi:ABC-type tungstate transport system permease subunit
MFSRKDIWPPPKEITSNMASVKVNLSSPIPFAKPDEIYRGNHLARLRLQVQLRIAPGPEQSELIKALSNEFIRYKDRNDAEPFSIAWISSNTTASFNHLASRSADLIITHHVVAENIAIKQGVADRSVYAWRDHWLLVGMNLSKSILLLNLLFSFTYASFSYNTGPKSNPANLSTEKTTSIYDHFAQIFLAAVETAGSTHSVKFLSRYDKSAANTKESSCWAAIGQTPWAHPHSSWYHQYTDSALAAIKVAASLGQYTLTDLGTWYTLSDEVREGMSVFVSPHYIITMT